MTKLSIITLIVFLLLPFYSIAQDQDSVSKHLDQLDQLVNPTLQWKLNARVEKDYKTGKQISSEKFELNTTLEGSSTYCGTPVLNTPMVLKLKLYSKGLSQVDVLVGQTQVDSFEIDGASGTGKEVEHETLITSTTELKAYPVTLRVQNKGFNPPRGEYWPERRNKPKEDYCSFHLNNASVFYKAAETNFNLMQDWLLSMKIGFNLIYPDFQRYTFTGKPFKIEDKRRTPKNKLHRVKMSFSKGVTAIQADMLTAGEPQKLQAAIDQSYKICRPVKQYAKQFKIHMIGNAHIDIAWLWRMRETVLVARNTYDTIMNNMEEYPELHYAQSQALTYEWMEKQYPDIFQRIKDKIKEGKWEVVGGMWVEPDCNLISGESWVRQLLYGKRYFKEKLGIDVDTGWNPDSFGYNWNMPQIYKKSGIKQFITQKIWWNDTTVFPHYIFWWQGVDDSRVMTYFPPVGYATRVTMPKDVANITRYEATTGQQKTLILYGLGDHGGGPNREILDRVRGYQKLYIAPEFIHSKAIDFLKTLEPNLGKTIPVWKDELYLEYHRGTYTSQGAIKKNNRQCESLLSSAEKIATLSFIQGLEKTFPRQDLEKAWKIVLTNQFHDILPGSSITPVYRDALEDYKRARSTMNNVISDAARNISRNVDLSSVEGSPVLVFNPLSWTRTDIVSMEVALEKDETVVIKDAKGAIIPVSVHKSCQAHLPAKVQFIAKDIPSIGYMVYSLTKTKSDTALTEETVSRKGNMLEVENTFYRLKINKKSGNIAGLFDKRLNKEFIPQGKEANVLEVYEDLPEDWDAWNIGYTGRVWQLDKAESVELMENSDVRTVIKVKKNFLGLSKNRYSPTEEFPSSFFTQYITIYPDIDRIDILTEADWWEDHMMLKATFPVTVANDYATYEIPFAHIKRTTKFETLWEKARFEVAALRWADLSQQDAGISLLNDSKYGYDIHGSTMKISLLRAPTWPDPLADRGKHRFTYSLYPHSGSVTDGQTVRQGRQLNTPLQAIIIDKAENQPKGNLPLTFSLFQVNSDSVILDSIKLEEGSNNLILRLFESFGKPAKAEVQCYAAPKKVEETNLMEQNPVSVSANGKSIPLDFKKFEIKTLRLEY